MAICFGAWVYLYGSENKRIDVPFRLITTKNEQDKMIMFVTNKKETPKGFLYRQQIL